MVGHRSLEASILGSNPSPAAKIDEGLREEPFVPLSRALLQVRTF